VDDIELEILARFEERADEIADEIATCTVAEVDGFGPINDARLHAEIRELARRHLDAYLHTARTGRPPPAHMLQAARERAEQRAREMVPLAAQVQSYLIAQRVIGAAIARCAGPDLRSREAALALTGRTFEYNVAATAAMADAYVDVVQGDLAELDSARRSLVEALLTSGAEAWPDLARRAIGLGLHPESDYVVVLAVVEAAEDAPTASASPRWAAQVIARSSGRPERNAFVVSRERDLVAVLEDAAGHSPRRVLDAAAAAISQAHEARLFAGVGPRFSGLAGFADSYYEARRALKHANERRPIVFGPQDVRLFDELTASGGDDTARLIPAATRELLADAAMAATVEALFAADLNVADAAKRLSLHPNSLRYRIKRIADVTGRDPRRLDDLLELVAAARLSGHPVTSRSDGKQAHRPG
jgi:hypothetical protein